MKPILLGFFLATLVFANPYWDPSKIAKDAAYVPKEIPKGLISKTEIQKEGIDVIRVDLSFEGDSFKFDQAIVESSGTEALLRRALVPDRLGSYRGVLVNLSTHKPLYYDSIGTGSEFRFLTRALTFRFPKVDETVRFDLYAEDPKTGILVKTISKEIHPSSLKRISQNDRLEIKLLKKAAILPRLRVNIYADGYTSTDSTTFFTDATRVSDTLVRNKLPGIDQFEIYGIYAVSKLKLGKALDLGMPVPERDSFLGLYYPYWDPFGRWYNIVYPTREQKFRNAIGQIPYDYPMALIDSVDYWGVGNFNELTALPSRHPSFTYLLLHEFGHFFGLNEEYEGGGKTELAFAPGISEPWSQNITFHPKKGELKWEKFVNTTTSLPTPSSQWIGNGPFGAYEGGYADTEPQGQSHKPGFNCTMESGTKFCPICTHAIQEKIKFDSGG